MRNPFDSGTSSHSDALAVSGAETPDDADACVLEAPLRRSDGSPQRVRHGLLQGRSWTALVVAMDAVTLGLAVAAALLGAARADVEPSIVVWVFPILVIAMLAVRGMYEPRLTVRIIDEAARVVSVTSIAAMIVLAVTVAVGSSAHDAELVARVWAFAMIYVSGGRLVLGYTQRCARSEAATGTPTLILGAGRIGAQVEHRLIDKPEFGLRPIGFVDAVPPNEEHVPGGRALPVLGGPEDLEDIVAQTGARHVVLAFLSSRGSDARLVPLVRQCEELGLEILLVPRLFESITVRMRLEHIGGMPLLRLRSVRPNGWQFAIKYMLDRAAAALIILLIAPLLIVIAVAVKVSSPGPLFFRQRRVGRDGCEFDMLKFRTMRGSPEVAGEADAAWAAGAIGISESELGPVEDRRTGIGKLLRRYSLDELPQFLNVLRGEMSLVGPRPERRSYVELFEGAVYRYGDRHRVKSGLTGWAQVHGLRGNTSLSDRIEWDNFYIENWSLWLDLKIVLLTVAAVLRTPE